MIELPEAVTLSHQISETLVGKRIAGITVLKSPHKFAWFHGDPTAYPKLLNGRTVDGAVSFGGTVEISLGDCRLSFNDGPNLGYYESPAEVPDKHQLLLEFADSTAFVASVQMYGGFAAFKAGTNDNRYYLAAKEAPSPITGSFDKKHFDLLLQSVDRAKITAKFFLATEQRIPGLGNGVLQDILFNARVHPKRKLDSLGKAEITNLYDSIRATLEAMTEGGGRDTEKDLFGRPGNYRTLMSRNTVGAECPRCGATIEKAAYGGGSVYFCPGCQPL